jgi:hypothetical protein
VCSGHLQSNATTAEMISRLQERKGKKRGNGEDRFFLARICINSPVEALSQSPSWRMVPRASLRAMSNPWSE